MAAAEDVQLFARPWELENLIGLGKDVHVKASINLFAATVPHLYLAKDLGCIVDVGAHGFLQGEEMEWTQLKSEEGRK